MGVTTIGKHKTEPGALNFQFLVVIPLFYRSAAFRGAPGDILRGAHISANAQRGDTKYKKPP